MSIYFDLSYRCAFLTNTIAPQLSALILIVLRSVPIYSRKPILYKTYTIYCPCLQHVDMPIYLDSQLEVNTIRCFLLPYAIGLLKSIATCLEILFLSFIFAQLVLEYSTSISRSQILRHTSFVGLSLFPKGPKYIFCLIVDLRYLLISFTALSCFFARSRSCWLSCLIQNIILGREYTIVYIILPIAF